MNNAYELFNLTPDATREELEAAYAKKREAYNPDRVTEFGAEFAELATQRRAELRAAYLSLRSALAAPPRLEEADERRRDRQTMWMLAILVCIGILVPLTRDIAVPDRTVAAEGADLALAEAQQAPGFAMESIDGGLVSLADYQGDVVLINIWATWCPPCVREIPRLVRLHEQFGVQGFAVLGVNTAWQDERSDVESFVRSRGINYPVLLDTDGGVSQAYSGRLLPTSYLVDRDGKIVNTYVGEIDEAQLEEHIAALVETDQ
ncbi:MAG: hypothetical protein GFH27_549371n17 [Chloroflexi bacterium AL-W]|nr:hypothetical protein [Chloroflexi bacterium AL-N1]NOK70878.1 hypothetical protein [Chloroflexi bacterium AL-N10]NOK78547.1 hypothetical protein [Chloroflexi bacterium AL-N5]NOK85779.1 hypothetical protein [Chloroflexi bacterium AL-W]NOK92695.1 hypothetical protein [Chloroflexi bacterium AL-N15]